MFTAHIFAEGNLRKWYDFHEMGTSETKLALVPMGGDKLQSHSEIRTNKGKYPLFQEEKVNKC